MKKLTPKQEQVLVKIMFINAKGAKAATRDFDSRSQKTLDSLRSARLINYDNGYSVNLNLMFTDNEFNSFVQSKRQEVGQMIADKKAQDEKELRIAKQLSKEFGVSGMYVKPNMLYNAVFSFYSNKAHRAKSDEKRKEWYAVRETKEDLVRELNWNKSYKVA